VFGVRRWVACGLLQLVQLHPPPVTGTDFTCSHAGAGAANGARVTPPRHARSANLEKLAAQMAALRCAWQADAAALAALGNRAAELEASEAALGQLRVEHGRFQQRVAMLQRLLVVRPRASGCVQIGLE